MKPSGRFKKRYVLFSLLLGGKPASSADAKRIIHEHFLSFFGELGTSSIAFKLVLYGEKGGKGILRCERGRVEEAIFCMALLSDWEGKACRLEPLSTSGSIKRV